MSAVAADLTLALTRALEAVVAKAAAAPGAPAPTHWPTRLWEVHAQTRLSVEEAGLALDRSKSWVYARIREGVMPAVEFDGELRIIAGDLRDWLKQREAIRVAPKLYPMRRPA